MLKKTAVNLFLIAWLSVLLIDATPTCGVYHRQLKDRLDPYLDVTGLWQGNWQMFAPSPDRVNVALVVEAEFEDGTLVVERSPDWRSLSVWQRFVRFREAEFVDSICKSSSRLAWEAFGEYLHRTVKHPTDPTLKPQVIYLLKESAIIEPPNEESLKDFPAPPAMTEGVPFFADDYGLVPD